MFCLQSRGTAVAGWCRAAALTPSLGVSSVARGVARLGGRTSRADQHDACVPSCTRGDPPEIALGHQQAGSFAAAALLGVCLALLPCQPASAYNVRLQDVENPQMQEGVRAATSGEFTRAERIFEGMLSADSSIASAWSNLGNVHMSQGRASQAVEDYGHAVQLAPDAPVPYLNRAIALEQLGVELQEQGQQQGAQGRWEAAVADCDEAIRHDPKEFAAWFNKGNVAMRLRQFDAAEECFQKAADLAPGIPGYRLREAQAMFQNGKGDAAVRLTRTVIRKNFNYAEAHASLAAMLYQDGRYAQAEDEYNTATELEPSLRNIDNVLASTRWPPRLYQSYSQFLNLEVSSSGPA